MRATSLGQAGILIETAHGSIVCDPWFVPAFFGSWFVFPRNDQLGDDLHERIRGADYLYISHLHGDHFDETWLADERNVRRDIAVLVPGYPSRELDQRLRALGFENLIRTTDGEELRLGGDGSELTVAIHVETSITDGPGGDSALVVSDGTSRLVNQNDCRTTDLAALAAHGPVDLHWLQYSGAIWYPMVYEMDDVTMRHLVDAKIESQLTRAMRYVESIGARAVVPSAGPPCFLDPALFHLNVVTGDEPSIFVDQRTFLARLDAAGHAGVLAIPGTTIEVGSDGVSVKHPIAESDVAAIFENKREYLTGYQRDWSDWLAAMHERWAAQPDTDLVPTLQEWWRPLLAACPTVREGIGAACLLRAGRRRDPHRLPRRRRARLRRRAVRVPLRDRPLARREGRRRTGRRLEQLAVPVVPVPGVASGRVQRVRLQLLQVAVAGADAAHRGGGATQAAPADGDRAGHRARRLGDAAPLPTPQRRSQRVRRGPRLRARVHAARLALRPRDRQMPDVRGSRIRASDAAPTATDVRAQLAPWTQTGMCIGMMFVSQMKSIAGIDTRTQPCEAG